MKRIMLLSAFAFSGLMMANGAVITATPGSLKTQLATIPSTDQELVVNGTIDVRDMRAIAERGGFNTLDLQGSTISAYSASAPDDFGQTFFKEGLVPQYVFFKTDISRVLLPSNTLEVGTGAFANSEVTEIVLPAGIKILGDHAFYGCVDLNRINMPSSLTTIGTYVFANCASLNSIDFRSTRLTTLPANAFSGCSKLRSLSLPTGLRTIGTHALEGTIISMIDLTQVTRFEDYALAGMGDLIQVSISPTASIGSGLLMDDRRIQTVIGSPVAIPDLYAANCRVLDIDDPIRGASTIGEHSFANTSATTLVLSPALTKIDAGAMENMNGLTLIDARNLGEQIPDVADDAFDGINTPKVSLYVDQYTEPLWQDHPVWGRFNVYSDLTTVIAITDARPLTKIVCHDQILTISSSEQLLNVEVYTLGGSLLIAAEPETSEFTTTLSTNDNVLIVRVRTEAGVDTAKVLVR